MFDDVVRPGREKRSDIRCVLTYLNTLPVWFLAKASRIILLKKASAVFVSMPPGAVYRHFTRAISPRYVIDARDRSSGVHEYSIEFQWPGSIPMMCTSAASRFNAARGSTPMCYVRRNRRRGKCSVCHRRSRQDVRRVRVQNPVLVPLGAVYRSVTLAVSATRGGIRYARAKKCPRQCVRLARIQHLGSPPGARCQV